MGEPGGLPSMGSRRVGHGEGDGTPLQYSCLENRMDGGAWWAAIYGVAQSRTRLKQLTFKDTVNWDWGLTPVAQWTQDL